MIYLMHLVRLKRQVSFGINLLYVNTHHRSEKFHSSELLLETKTLSWIVDQKTVRDSSHQCSNFSIIQVVVTSAYRG